MGCRSFVPAGTVLLVLSACGVGRPIGTSPALLLISTLEGRPGTASVEGTFSHTFASDVMTAGRVVDDVGRVTLGLALRDPGTIELPSRPSPVNAVALDRYRVRYIRSDGRNLAGVDVPHAFDGALTLRVGPDGATGSLVLVRAQAKLEAPLVGLRDFQGAIVLSTLAEVTFYGRDQAGHAVTASGLVGVNFADWADAE